MFYIINTKLITYLIPFFSEENKKMDVTWNSNHTVTFQIARYYHYDSDNSNGSLHDNFTTLDSAALVSARK